MKKYLIAIAILLGMTAGARAESVMATMDTVSSTVAVRGIDISSAPTTNVIIDENRQYRQVCVQNLDTSSFLACGENVNVSTLTASNLMGVVVPPAATASTPQAPSCFSVVAGSLFYCRTSSVSGTTRAVIVRGR